MSVFEDFYRQKPINVTTIIKKYWYSLYIIVETINCFFTAFCCNHSPNLADTCLLGAIEIISFFETN